MKKYSIHIFLLSLLLFSCDDFIDVEPVLDLPRDQALKSKEDAEALLITVYDAVQSGNFQGNTVPVVADVFAGDDLDVGNNYGDITGLNFTIFNGNSRNIWRQGYLASYYADVIIDALNSNVIEDETLTNDISDRLRGEAYFLKALSYFNMLQFFAKPYSANPNSDLGLVLRTGPVESIDEANADVPRSTVEETYDFILTTLDSAETLLPENNDKGKPTKWSAKALLARISFDKAEYSTALAYAQELIDEANNNGTFDLDSDVKAAFNTQGTDQAKADEVIFELIYLNDDGHGMWGQYNADNNVLGLSSEFLAIVQDDVDDGGKRGTDLYDISTEATKKWDLQNNNMPVIRLPEMYLIKAESLWEINEATWSTSGTYVSEIHDALNALRTRAGNSTMITTSNREDLRDAIRTERRLELATEGFRYRDLLRRKQNVRGEDFNSCKLLLKIPDTEIRGFENIQQNDCN